MKISVLMENYCFNAEKELKEEHGLSLHIEHEGKKLLFDTGATGAFMENADKMGISIEEVDIAILSHAHIDHAGGLVKFLTRNTKAKVYMSKHATKKLFVKIFFMKKDVSVPQEVFEKFRDRICFVDNFTEIVENVYLVPDDQKHPFPLGRTHNILLEKKGEQYELDRFEHELSLVIHNKGKLEMITGCSHNGISNMVENASFFFPDVPIHTVIGGFHLMGIPLKNYFGEKKSYVIDLAEKMLDLNIDMVYTAHCTGMKAYNTLKNVMKDKIDYISTGTQMEL